MKNVTTNINRLVRPRISNEEFYAWLIERLPSPATDEEVREYIHATSSQNAVNNMGFYLGVAKLVRNVYKQETEKHQGAAL